MVHQPASEFQILLKALGYVRTHWWLFLLEVALIYGSALNDYHHTPSVYESHSSVLIDNSRKQMYQSFMLQGLSASSLARKNNLAQLLTSEEVIERLRNALTDYYNTEGRPAHLRGLFPGSVPLPPHQLRSLLNLNWDRTSDIFSIRCSGANPDAAHDLCLSYMNTVQTYYPEIGQREAMMKRDFLSRQIASLTRQIAEREQNLIDFQKRNPDFMSFLQADMEERGRARLRVQIGQIREELHANRAMKQLLFDAPQAKRGEQQSLQAPIQALTLRVSELQYQIKLTEQSRNPDRDERLVALRRALDDASQQLAKLNDEEVQAFARNPLQASSVRDQVAKLELEYRIGLVRLSALERQLDTMNQKEKKYQQQRFEYDRLVSELSHRKKLLTNLYNKEQQTELELSAGSAEIFRLQEPNRNVNRVAPQLSRYLYGSLSLCVFALVVTAVLLIGFFPRLDSEAEVNRLNLPVIGKVPHIRRSPGMPREIPSFGLEYLKIMNYRILRETKDLKCPVIVITSAHAREGKSTVTQLLAQAAQSPNRRTLLIDGDMLTAHPNKFFGIQEDHTPGLHSILTQASPPGMDLLSVPTTLEGLSFLPRGERMEPSPLPDFLKPVQKKLEELRLQYDTIFIDTPPLFASNLAHQWAGLADLIVLVARLFVTRPKDITEAIQTCKVFSKAAVGVALNCVPVTSIDRRVSHYYFSRRKTKPTRLAA